MYLCNCSVLQLILVENDSLKKPTEILSLAYLHNVSIKRFVFITNMDSVNCAVQTYSVNKRDFLSSFKEFIASYSYCVLAGKDGIRTHCRYIQNTPLCYVLYHTTDSDLEIVPDSWIIHD